MAGGDFTGEDFARMWSQEDYAEIVKNLDGEGELLVTVNDAEVQRLSELLEDVEESDGFDNEEIDPDSLLEEEIECPRCGFEFEPDE
jgi:L-2-hydroxyglutarate oxidase LhgO